MADVTWAENAMGVTALIGKAARISVRDPNFCHPYYEFVVYIGESGEPCASRRYIDSRDAAKQAALHAARELILPIADALGIPEQADAPEVGLTECESAVIQQLLGELDCSVKSRRDTMDRVGMARGKAWWEHAAEAQKEDAALASGLRKLLRRILSHPTPEPSHDA